MMYVLILWQLPRIEFTKLFFFLDLTKPKQLGHSLRHAKVHRVHKIPRGNEQREVANSSARLTKARQMEARRAEK